MLLDNGGKQVNVAKCKHYLKFVGLLVVLAIFGVLVTACGGSSTSNGGSSSGGSSSSGGNKGPFTIGVSNGFVASEWRTQMIQDMQAANAEYMNEGRPDQRSSTRRLK